MLLFISVINALNSINLKASDNNILYNLILKNKKLNEVINSTNSHETQIIYTQINRNNDNKPSFQSFTFNVNDSIYFNPASFVKLPTALLALEKLERLSKYNINLSTKVIFDSGYKCQRKSENELISIGQLVKNVLILSDDKAYNRLYEFVGQEELNKRLWNCGLSEVRIIQRFQNCNPFENRLTNPLYFINDQGDILWKQSQLINSETYLNSINGLKKGILHMGANGNILNKPKDFTFSNFISLKSLHELLLYIMFPEYSNLKLDISAKNIEFFRKNMGILPEESDLLNPLKYKPFYKKFLLWDDSLKCQIRSFNVNAYSYGYIGDCAYICDYKHNIEYILVVYINTNKSQNILPENYNYEKVGIPYLKELSRTIYDFELKRTRQKRANLDEFKIF